LRIVALTLASLTACASAPIHEPTSPTHLEDPGPAIPEARVHGETGETVALVVRSSHEGAIEHVRDALTALVEGDRPRLERMLAPTLVRASPTLSRTTRSRAAVLAIAFNPSRRRGITPGIPLDRLVVVDELRGVPLDDTALGDLPEGLEPTDVAVRVPLTNDGRSIFRSLLPGWGEEGQMIVGRRAPYVVKGL
jgi:hypothetical protein